MMGLMNEASFKSSIRKRACAFDPRLRAPTPHPPGVGACAGNGQPCGALRPPALRSHHG